MRRALGSPGARPLLARVPSAKSIAARRPSLHGVAGKTGDESPLQQSFSSLRTWSVPLGIGLVAHAMALLLASGVTAATRQPFSTVLTAWDSKWYLAAASGYPHHLLAGRGNSAQSSLGFFPGLPLLIRLVHLVFATGYLTSGVVVSTLTGLAAPVAVWWALRDKFGEAAAVRGTAIVFFSPGAFVLAMVYSEGLLITSAALSLVALRRQRWVLAGLLAAVASATDPIGLAALVPCAWCAWQAVRQQRRLRPLLAPAIAPAGTIGFFAFLWAYVGTPFAWFITQRRGWEGGGFFMGIPTAFSFVFHHGFTDINDTVKMVSVVVILVLLVPFFRARPGGALSSYVVATLLLAAASPIVSWTPRVVLRAFPLLAGAGARAPRRLFPAIVGASALLMATLAAMSWGLARPPFTP